MSTIAARELKVGTRILTPSRTRRPRVDVVTVVRYWPDVAFGALERPLPQVEIEVRGGWASETFEPDALVELAPAQARTDL